MSPTESTEPPPSTGNPWVTHSTAVTYDNPWIEVTHREVTTPSGTPGIYGLVHFKAYAVGVIPIDDEDHTWLVGQYRYALNKYSWEIPAGGGTPGVDATDTAQRELGEECGLQAQRFELLAQPVLSNSITDETGYIFAAYDLDPCPTNPDETEELQLWRLPVSQAIDLVLHHEIDDALSIMGLLRLAVDRGARD